MPNCHAAGQSLIPVLVTLVYLVILTAVNFVVSMMSGFSSLFTVLVTDPDAAAAISLGMLVSFPAAVSGRDPGYRLLYRWATPPIRFAW